MDDPKSPFHDMRVRKAVSLALDRQYLADQETAGMGIPWGNFIPPEWPGAVQRPPDEFDLTEAKRLMAEVGYPNGFAIHWFTPVPAGESLSLRVMEQLRAIGIKGQMNVMERPVYMQKLLEGKPQDGYGHKGFPGRQIVMSISVIPGDASLYVDNWLRCDGSYAFICDKRIDALWQRYLASQDPQEREDLIKQAQKIVLDEYMFVPIYINSFTLGVGPRIAGNPATTSAPPWWSCRAPLRTSSCRPSHSIRAVMARGGCIAMKHYIVQRLLYSLITLWLLSVIVFTVVRFTVDPALLMSDYPGVRPEDLAALRAQWGLDQPYLTQYVMFISNVVRGDLGTSFQFNMPVNMPVLDVYLKRLPNSLQLGLAGFLISISIGLPLGMMSAVRVDS